MLRRNFLRYSVASCGLAAPATAGWKVGLPGSDPLGLSQVAISPPAYSVIPVVGDGKWIWNKPPADATGYLEPRPYSLDVGVSMEGIGRGSQISATTPVPVSHPEQKIEDIQIETNGCQAEIRQISAGAAQLFVTAAEVVRGQVATAVAKFKLTLSKQYHAFNRDMFPAKQSPPAEVRKASLQDSPGIQTSSKQVRDLSKQLASKLEHPWDMAEAFSAWVQENIRPQLGSYTSVTSAIDNRRGDCEEMSAVFVALCRAVNIPARLVWVPNHNWAEFFLTDSSGTGHWIPVHTACYRWFGWTGVHELVLQKGDRLYLPEQHKQSRLMEDWLQATGRKPRTKYTAELKPLPPESGSDAGPGARSKDASGEWRVVGTHEFDRYARR